MDWKRFDAARRSVGPVELDLVESYAQGRINRRDFMRRGAIIGLSAPFLTGIVAACGSDDAAPSTTTGASGGTTGAGGASGGTIRIAAQKPATVLDPVRMQDLGAYGIIAQCFEFLCTLDDAGTGIAPGLATSWSPNEDGSVWTFQLREGVKWQDGSDFSSADVAATMDRLVAENNAGLAGVIEQGAVDASDPNVAVFNLAGPNGNFPFLVSVFNAQTPITPAAYAVGTTLDDQPSGTGPWKLDSFDPNGGAVFSRNPDWWGGTTPLDGVEFEFFDDIGTMVTAVQGGSSDAIVQFQVIGGDALFDNPDFTVLGTQAATHRQVWMRVDEGQFSDKRVRQALAYTFDREAMVQILFRGRADIANDHVIAPFLPFFDSGVPQRTKDIDMAKQLLADAGFADGLEAVLHFGDLQEIPELATLIQSGASEAGFNLQLAGESQDTFYGAQWCPAEPADPPCSGAAELGIVDYGHRPTPDVYLNAALASGGVWNSSQYMNADFDAAFAEYQAAVGVDAQKAAAKKIEENLNDEVPVGIPYFYNYLGGHSNSFKDVRVSALGQMFVDKASQA